MATTDAESDSTSKGPKLSKAKPIRLRKRRIHTEPLRVEYHSDNSNQEQIETKTDLAHQVQTPDQVAFPCDHSQQPLSGARGEIVVVLQQHKKAIGWKLSDLPGINPFSFAMH
ncbi:hypothetical protein CR513_31214, partial [Mucuna pruriens]